MHSALWSSTLSHEWIVDSRATRHMTKYRHLFSDYNNQHRNEKISIGDDSTLLVYGFGTAVVDNAKFGNVLDVLGLDQISSVYCVTHTNKKVKLWLDRWGVKDISGEFKVVAYRYREESKHIYKRGISSSTLAHNKFIAMIANTNEYHML